MQNAKDSFYVMFRDRIASTYPERMMTLRGVERAALVVAENELASTFVATDVFWLRWTKVAMVEADGLLKMQCEISYATSGTEDRSGMDRGRMLAQMDLELATALRRDPQNVIKTAYTEAGATAMATSVFWTDPVFGKASIEDERLSRTVTVEVFSYEEAEEL